MTHRNQNTGTGESSPETAASTSSQLGGSVVPHNSPVSSPSIQSQVIYEDKEIISSEMRDIPPFPIADLERLNEMISKPRWVIPVLPKCELEKLIDASIALAQRGLDEQNEYCQHFYREGLTISFNKILIDDAVSNWKPDIHVAIRQSCERLVRLCVLKLHSNNFYIFDLMYIMFNPQSKFHTFHSTKSSESINLSEEETFASSSACNLPLPHGWLVDLLNYFGRLNGFEILKQRILESNELSVPLIFALLRPFCHCYALLTNRVMEVYMAPIVDKVMKFLDTLTDEDLKKEVKNESKNDQIAVIAKCLKCFASGSPNREELIKQLDIFRLKVILRFLTISSFNGKMNALNEINKVINSVAYFAPSRAEADEWLTSERLATWITKNKVLSIVMRDSLHQPQYVEKLEKMLRFIIKEQQLTLSDLDDVWAAQAGKHEAIVKNVHDLLAKLAWDFTPVQLDHLFTRFQESWHEASRKQREKLLELIRMLAEDDKEGLMAHKVLCLLWSLAQSKDCPNEIIDQALNAHIKILDCSCSHDRDDQKIFWIEKFIGVLRSGDGWVLAALRQIRDIFRLFPDQSPHQIMQNRSNSQRSNLINKMQVNFSLVTLVAENLSNHMQRMRRDHPHSNPNVVLPGSRYSHIEEVEERLNFLRFLLKDGSLWLCAPQAEEIWKCLAVNSVYPCDRENAFKWFSQLMGEEPDLDPEINRSFFENQILQLDPSLLTEDGIICFDRFFKAVNTKEQNFVFKRQGYLMTNDDLIGLDYLWKVILDGKEDIASKAIRLLIDAYTNLAPNLKPNSAVIHEDFIETCLCRLKSSLDTATSLEGDKDNINKWRQEQRRLIRMVSVLREYISEWEPSGSALPLGRAARGPTILVNVRFHGRPGLDDLELISHEHETIGNLRRNILTTANKRAGSDYNRVEICINNEIIDSSDDRLVLADQNYRDRLLIQAKLSAVIRNPIQSSPDSSSDSAPDSPNHLSLGVIDATLPAMIVAANERSVDILLRVCDMGCRLEIPSLRNGVHSLFQSMPPPLFCIRALQSDRLDQMFFRLSTSSFLLHLEILYSLLLPANEPNSDMVFQFQAKFVQNGGVATVLSMLTKNNFLPQADPCTKRNAYIIVLRISKILFLIVGFAALEQDGTHNQNSFTYLHNTLKYVPPAPDGDFLRGIARRLFSFLPCKAVDLFPDKLTINSIKKLALSSLTESGMSPDSIRPNLLHEPKPDGVRLRSEALQVLTICLALCPDHLDFSAPESSWDDFIFNMLLRCPDRSIRRAAVEQFYIIVTKCILGSETLKYFIMLLFKVVQSDVDDHADKSCECFILLCKLLNWANITQEGLADSLEYLNAEVNWLREVKAASLRSEQVHDILLEGHLGICKELVGFQNPRTKYIIGCDPQGSLLMKDLIEDFLFPASKHLEQYSKTGYFSEYSYLSTPLCKKPSTINAAFELLVSLCLECLSNFRYLVNALLGMFYSTSEIITEWDYEPPVGAKPENGFVGLKNAGATCYMNSVLQQLYLVPAIRQGILSVEGVMSEYNDDEEDLEISPIDTYLEAFPSLKKKNPHDQARMVYNLGVLKHVQAIFGHLAESKLQMYVPKGFWRHFKFGGESVNLREQHDSLEFLNSLVDSIDESMKFLGVDPIFSKILGGSFADQKICKGCIHRYSREEPFTSVSVDVRNNQNLLDSLEQYVKGDLLEAGNAYYCEKCETKVDTVKRMCIKRLPQVLVIQLKRFDYDWERDCAIKFNDYFEFPVDLDLEPFTVEGLAQIEGEVIGDENSISNDDSKRLSTCYRLTGVVVHSGSASGGHYYSYIASNVSGDDQEFGWYKFDDGEVSLVRSDHQELTAQWFGGDYLGEVYDHMMKRMAFRRQKRWWNAYLLFYERLDSNDTNIDSLAKDFQMMGKSHPETIEMPRPILNAVHRQTLHFMHTKSQFSPEYFHFIRRLVASNGMFMQRHDNQEAFSVESDEFAFCGIQLISRFLFHVGLRTKKSLRGQISDWEECITHCLRDSSRARRWFMHDVFFRYPNRFAEYLLECPSPEVRSFIVKVLVFVAVKAHQDLSTPPPELNIGTSDMVPNFSLSELIVRRILMLLRKDFSEVGRQLTQYFQFFVFYSNCDHKEKAQLIKLDVPFYFVQIAADDGPQLKYQYGELPKLNTVVANLIVYYDVSAHCQSTKEHILPNPFKNGEPIDVMPKSLADKLFLEFNYIKKLIEEAADLPDTTKILSFLSWENPSFSSQVVSELLWQITYAYTNELRPYFDLLRNMLLIDDTWQHHRINRALLGAKGGPEEREGLFDTILRSKSHYQKRAYQCIKMLVHLFKSCQIALNILHKNDEYKQKWRLSVDWLRVELERRPYGTSSQFSYNNCPNWATGIMTPSSNDTTTNNLLERSNSARETLHNAGLMLPNDEPPFVEVQRRTASPPAYQYPSDAPPPYASTSATVLNIHCSTSDDRENEQTIVMEAGDNGELTSQCRIEANELRSMSPVKDFETHSSAPAVEHST